MSDYVSVVAVEEGKECARCAFNEALDALRNQCDVALGLIAEGNPVLPREINAIFDHARNLGFEMREESVRVLENIADTLHRRDSDEYRQSLQDLNNAVAVAVQSRGGLRKSQLANIFNLADELRPSHTGFQNLHEIEKWAVQELDSLKPEDIRIAELAHAGTEQVPALA